MRLVLAKIKRLFTRGVSSLFNARFLKGFGWAVFVSAVLVGTLSFIEPVAAVGSLAGDAADFVVTGITKLLLVTARLAIALTVFFLRFFITLASYNNYINTPVVQVGWIMVRDVANMFFVVALLVIAFGTILGIEQYEWKKGLVKLVLAAILINFSNLLAQLVIDAAHVFTITFLNAIAATAGGNLIEMFKLTSILGFVQKPPTATGDVSNVRLELLGGAMMAAFFAVWAAIAMGAYVVVMMARVVLLWVLIIMSPLAFIFKVLPATEGYAQKWGKEFKEQVLVAPIMVFFMWLTFATLGNGQIINSIQKGDGDASKGDGDASSVIPLQVEGTNEIAISISKVSTWENMASFLIALAFLFIGIKEVGESGAVGSKLIGNAVNFGKKVATIASGVATAQWLGGQARDKGTGLIKGSAWHMPIVGGKQIARKWEDTKNAAKEGFYRAAATPKDELKRANRLIGFVARRSVRKTKHSGKTKSAAEDAEKLAFKRTSTSSGSSIAGQLRDDHFSGWKDKDGKFTFGDSFGSVLANFGMLPGAILGAMSARSSEFLGLGDKTGQGHDRRMEGRIEAESMRKAAKDKELISKEKQKVLSEHRIKNGKRETHRENLAEEIVGREEKAAATGDKERKMFDTIKKESVKKGQKELKKSMAEIAKKREAFKSDTVKKLEGDIKVSMDALDEKNKSLSEDRKNELDTVGIDADGGNIYDISKEEESIKKLEEANDGIREKFGVDGEREYDEANKELLIAQKQLEEAKEIREENPGAALEDAVKDAHASLAALEEKLKDSQKDGDPKDIDAQKAEIKVAKDAVKAAEDKAKAGDVAGLEAKAKIAQQKFDAINKNQGRDVIKDNDLLIEKAREEITNKEAAKNEKKNEIINRYDKVKKESAEYNQVQAKRKELADYKETKEYEKEDADAKRNMDNFIAAELNTVKNVTTKRMLAKLAADATSAELAQAEVRLDANLQAGPAGNGFMKRIASAEVGQEAAKSFLEKVKSANLKEEFKKAGKALTDAIDAPDMKLTAAQDANPFIQSLREKQFSEREQNALSINKAEAEAAAAAMFVELGDAGATTPSTAFVELSKRLTDVFNKLDETGRADFASKNLAHIVHLKKQGKELTTSQQAYAFGMMNNLVQQANADDQLFDAASKFNQMLDNPALYSAEETEKYEALKGFLVDEVGAIQLKNGRYVANKSDARANGLIQNYVLTGGNNELIADHSAIGALKDSVNADDGQANISYKEAIRRHYASKYKSENDGKEGRPSGTDEGEAEFIKEKTHKFMEGLEKSATLLNEGASKFKQYALDTGHVQLGGHQFYDQELGTYRMSTEKEAEGFMISSAVKRKGMEKASFHAFGNLDASNGVLSKVNARMYAALLNSVKTSYEASRMHDRTRDGLMGYTPGQEAQLSDDQVGLFGGKEEDIKRKFGSVETMIEDVIIPQLIGSPGAFSLIANSKFANVDKNAAANGVINIEIDGSGIKATNMSDLIKQITAKYKKDHANETDQVKIAEIDKIIKALNKSKNTADALAKKVRNSSENNPQRSATPEEVIVAEAEEAERQ